jgi:DNA-binding LacI/PurR family transcriptional regulator
MSTTAPRRGCGGWGTGLVGLVINDLRNPFFTEFATSAQMALSERGYATVVANTDEDPGLQAQVVASMVEHGVLALAISPAYGGEEETFGLLGGPGCRCSRCCAGRPGACPSPRSTTRAAGGSRPSTC